MTRDWLARRGAVVGDDGRVSDFGDPRTELDGALTGCMLVDRSDLGRLRATGPDMLPLLHRLSTADVQRLPVGRGAHGALLTAKGRFIQRFFAYHDDGAVWLISGPGGSEATRTHIDRFTVVENTGLADVGDDFLAFGLLGPRAREAAAAAGCGAADGLSVAKADVEGRTVRVLGGDGLSAEGVLMLVAPADARVVWDCLAAAAVTVGGRPAGSTALESWRILRGLPENGTELTEDRNPLEAGLWDAVSFDKGCYVGQEVVARLRTYEKVSRDLRGLRFPDGAAEPPVPAPLYRGRLAVGLITSAIVPPGRSSPVALGFVKRRSVSPGARLTVGPADGGATQVEVVELPFPV